LRQVLAAQPEKFVQTVTQNLLTYALGRTVEYYDMPAVRKIVRVAAANDHRMSSYILGVVASAPFRMSRADRPSTSSTEVH